MRRISIVVRLVEADFDASLGGYAVPSFDVADDSAILVNDVSIIDNDRVQVLFTQIDRPTISDTPDQGRLF